MGNWIVSCCREGPVDGLGEIMITTNESYRMLRLYHPEKFRRLIELLEIVLSGHPSPYRLTE